MQLNLKTSASPYHAPFSFVDFTIHFPSVLSVRFTIVSVLDLCLALLTEQFPEATYELQHRNKSGCSVHSPPSDLILQQMMIGMDKHRARLFGARSGNSSYD